MADISENVEPLPEVVETDQGPPKRARVPEAAEVVDGPPVVLPAPPEPKRIGRPTGAKDAQKRKTPVRAKRIVEQPIVREPPQETPVVQAPAQESPVVPMPERLPDPSPRSLMREAQSLILQAHYGRSESRRAHFQDSVFRCTQQFP